MVQVSERLHDGSRRVLLTADQHAALHSALLKLQRGASLHTALISDASGYLIAVAGELPTDRATLVTAIAAANFSAVAELGRVIGESSGFRTQIHEGDQFSIVLTAVNTDFLLSAILGKRGTIGLARALALQSVPLLCDILRTKSDAAASNPLTSG